MILAHRLSSVIDADRILVLDSGHVVESGRHAELIRRDGPYRRLMGAQAEERGDDDRCSLDLAEPSRAAGQRDETAPISAPTPTDGDSAAAARSAAAATLG